MLRYLLDTNSASFLIKGRYPSLRERMEQEHSSDFAISVVTEAELLFGLKTNPQATRIHRLVQQFLGRTESLPWQKDTARVYAELRAELKRKGLELSPLDTMIAAHASELNLTLITHDGAFARIGGRLRVEDWTAE